MDDRIVLFEVGPRDGLQNLKSQVPTTTKIALIDALSGAGLRKIEATSFVDPRWIPQLADAADVMSGLTRHTGTTYAALVPNERGLDRAIRAECDEIAVFAAASEGFSRSNLNCSIDESMSRFTPIIGRARDMGLRVRAYLSTVIACPFDGPTPPDKVALRTRQLLDMGCYEVSLGDTIGAGTADSLSILLDCLLDHVSADRLAGHFHDTHGMAADLVRLSLGRGLRTFDASVSGLGGCPYAPGAPGNVATGVVLDIAEETGLSHDVDRTALEKAERIAEEILRQGT